MKIRIYLMLAILLPGLLLVAFRKRQDLDGTFLALLRQKLDRYNKELPAEKIYLQLDKPFYKPGEDIWFRAFVTDGMTHKASPVSQVVYVELINPRGGVEKTLTLPVAEGGTNGDFTLEESAPGGLYKVRAYSQWMKNFGEETFFEKQIQVQKVLMPRLLLRVEFGRKAYGPADRVSADFEAKDLQNNPLAGQSFSFSVQLGGQSYHQGTAITSKDGKAAVQFTLPDTLKTADGLLNIAVPFEGKSESISRSVPIVLNRVDVQFFPEGGELVQNISGRVAFKALNEFGKPADVEGEVIDSKGAVVQTFRSFHQGMGAFRLRPGAGTYHVRLTRPTGIGKLYALPPAAPKGYALAVDTVTAGQMRVSFHAPVSREVTLVTQVRGQLYFSRQLTAAVGSNQLEIPLDPFPAGVAQVTLFDHNGVPRCERLAFVNRHKQLRVQVSADKPHYGPREKVELTIRTLDEDSLPVPAALSLAVADDKLLSFADDKSDNILSYLLVSSDLKGKVEEPNFYFKKDEPKAAPALDYLLLTQGWRRFTWQQVLAGGHKVAHLPEKTGTLAGRVVHAVSGKPQTVTVTLFELDERRRSARLQTLPDGSFTFLNVNPTVPVQLFAQAGIVKNQNVRIVLDRNSPYSNLSENREEKYKREERTFYNLDKTVRFAPRQPVPETEFEQTVIVEEPAAASLKVETTRAVPSEAVADEEVLEAATNEEAAVASNNLSLAPDVKALSEVVVVGYGAESRRDLTGSVAVVQQNELMATMPRLSVEQTLQGRTAGIMITNGNAAPGEGANLRIRGASSIAGSEPLYVVDGVAVESSLNYAFSPVGYLSPDEISSITVLKSPEATSIYGSGAANGVVVITTKKGDYAPYANPSPRTGITSVYLQPRAFSVSREFYAPVYSPKNQPAERSDFRSTVYWNPAVQTDKNGTAKVTFYNSDEETAFRVTVEGIAVNGLPGREEFVYATQLPLSLDAKVPSYLTFEDRVQLPVFVKNNTAMPLTGRLSVQLPVQLEALTATDTTISLPPGGAQTVYVSCTVRPVAGKGKLRIAFGDESRQDAMEAEIEVQPKGFPTQTSFSGKELDKGFSFRINEPVRGSIKAEFKAYPDLTGDLMAGIESILQEPHGCFEQTSASTYPNILALQYLKETKTLNQQVEARARQYIRQGYRRLAGFETAQHGFEWYGDTPPHEGLTAFGLMEFTEMQRVYDGVDPALIERTKKWLLGRRTGDGNFKQNRGKYGFSAASREVNNAYVVYALSEAGVKNIEKEYEYAYQEAMRSKDAYRMAVLAAASFNLKKNDRGEVLLRELFGLMDKKGIDGLPADHSIVISYGKSLQVETAALVALAILKSSSPDVGRLTKIIQYLLSSRAYGGFGSTQATVLSLKALTEHARFSAQAAAAGTVALYLNDQLINSKDYEKGARGEITVSGVEQYMQPGPQQFRVVFTGTKDPLPYSLNASWSAYTPNANPACKVDLRTDLSEPSTAVGKTVRLTTTLKNRTAQGQPMTVALVGIPSGLSPQPWQLKELQERGVFDFYEVRNNYVVFYYRELGPKAVHVIHLDLKAEVPGVYQAPAGTAYLYYTAEHKDWEAGESIEVTRPE